MKQLSRHTSFHVFFIAILFLISCSGTRIVSYELSTIDLADSLTGNDPVSSEMIAPYKAKLDEIMNEVLNTSEMIMDKNQPESLLGNFVADIAMAKANQYYQPEDGQLPHFCLLNNGGLRTTLPKGDITRGKVFELMPFENEIVVLTLSGEKTEGLFRYVAGSGGMPVSGIRMGIIGDAPALDGIIINGLPFDRNKSYKVVTSDYLANGGDRMTFFADPLKREDTGIKLRDAIIEYMKEEKTKGNALISKFDGRIYHVQ